MRPPAGTAQYNKADAGDGDHRRDAAVGPRGHQLDHANFLVGDTITVNGTPINFVAAGAVGNQLNVTDSISTLLAKIDAITGTAFRRRSPAARSRCTPAPPPTSR